MLRRLPPPIKKHQRAWDSWVGHVTSLQTIAFWIRVHHHFFDILRRVWISGGVTKQECIANSSGRAGCYLIQFNTQMLNRVTLTLTLLMTQTIWTYSIKYLRILLPPAMNVLSWDSAALITTSWGWGQNNASNHTVSVLYQAGQLCEPKTRPASWIVLDRTFGDFLNAHVCSDVLQFWIFRRALEHATLHFCLVSARLKKNWRFTAAILNQYPPMPWKQWSG